MATFSMACTTVTLLCAVNAESNHWGSSMNSNKTDHCDQIYSQGCILYTLMKYWQLNEDNLSLFATSWSEEGEAVNLPQYW